MIGDTLDQVRLGGRNFIRPGDLVRVKPSQPRKHDGGDATVRRIYRNGLGVIEVEVAMGPVPDPDKRQPRPVRTFFLHRLERRTARR